MSFFKFGRLHNSVFLLAAVSIVICHVVLSNCNADLQENENPQNNDLSKPSFSQVQTENQEHIDSDNGFKILLPGDWEVIPNNMLKKQSEALSNDKIKIDYIAGFQAKSDEYFSHPMMLVRKLPKRFLPREQIKAVAQLFKESGTKISQNIDERSGLKTNTQFGVPILEKETGIVWVKIKLDGFEGQKVDGVMAHFYADDHILQFSAGTTVERASRDWPVMNKILRSVELKPDPADKSEFERKQQEN